jgi:hypothetical protein
MEGFVRRRGLASAVSLLVLALAAGWTGGSAQMAPPGKRNLAHPIKPRRFAR